MGQVIFFAVLTLILIVAGFFVPVAGFFALMLCPLPLAVCACGEGHKKAAFAEIIVEAVLLLAISPTMALYFLLGCAPLSGTILILSESKKYKSSENYLICVAVSIVSKLFVMFVFWMFTGKNILLPDANAVKILMSQIYGNDREIKNLLNQVLIIFPKMIPAILILFSSLEAFLNYSLCNILVKKFYPSKKHPEDFPAFTSWRFPKSLMTVLFFALMIGYFTDFDDHPDLAMFAINLQILINFIMYAEGFSLIFWFMNRYKFNKIFKSLGGILLLFFPFLWAWVIIMGMCDNVFNFREKLSGSCNLKK